MATIVTRKRADGPRYTAIIRLKRDGVIVHREAQTFSTKVAAKEWARRREVELEDPASLVMAASGGPTFAALIRWYIDTYETLSQWQRSKQAALEFLEKHTIAQIDPFALTTDVLIAHVHQRRLGGVSPSTAWNDLVWIRVVLEAAKTAKNLPLRVEAVDEAREYCLKHRLIARSKRRERRPTNEELQKLDEYYQFRDRHKCTVVPMRTMMWFAIVSTRREAEICRLERADNDAQTKSGLVRDAKHPRNKMGNHLRFKYTPEGWGIVQAQPDLGPYVFPYNPKTVGDAFTSACHILGIEDLHFHDLRHEAISRLFELGYDIHEIAQFSLHSSWEDLKRYTHLRPENMREVTVTPAGDIVVVSPKIKITTLQCPPPEELVPQNARQSRSRLFARQETNQVADGRRARGN